MANSRAHRLFPWIVTWDNHEVDNDYAGDKDQDGSGREDFLKR
jgi:alkaline phosphatase D